MRQGPVIIVLLSDCEAGEGGTAYVPGSHFPLLSLKEAGASPHTHETVNEEFARRMRALTEGGRVALEAKEVAEGMVGVEQIVGRAGDVFLFHPLLVHSGTTNCTVRGKVRVMANGMARRKVTGREGGEGDTIDPIFARTLEFSERALAESRVPLCLCSPPTGPDPKHLALKEALLKKEKEAAKREKVRAERARVKGEKEGRRREKKERKRERGGEGRGGVA